MDRQVFNPILGVKDPLAMTNFKLASRSLASAWAKISELSKKLAAVLKPAIIGGYSADDIRYYGGDLAAAVGAIGSESKTLFITMPVTVSANLTTLDNVSIVVLKGGSFAISTGVTLTFEGPFQAPYSQVFSGLGTVEFSRPRPVLPEWWGAGTTSDDTSAIQKAVDTGQNVEFFPLMTYTLTDRITGLSAGQKFSGGGSILRRANSSITAWSNVGEFFYVDVDRVEFWGLEFDGNKANNASNNKGDVILCQGANFCSFRDLYLHDYGRDGITFGDESNDNLVHGSRFIRIGLGSSVNGGNGVAIVSGSRNIISNNFFSGDPANATESTSAIDIEPNNSGEDCVGNLVVNNTIDFVRLGQGLACYTGDTAANVSGVYTYPSRGNIYKGNAVYSSDPAKAGAYAFQGRNCKDLILEGNYFQHGATHCCRIGGAAVFGCSIMGNQFLDSDGCGLQIPDSADRCKIIGNKSRGNGTLGISINGGDFPTVHDNEAEENGGNGISIGGHQSPSLKGNKSERNGEHGINIASCFDTIVEGNRSINNGQSANNTYAALRFSGTWDKARIKGNTLGSESAESNKVDYCVEEASAASTNGTTILEGNHYLDFATARTNLATGFPVQLLDEKLLAENVLLEVRSRFKIEYSDASPEGVTTSRPGSLLLNHNPDTPAHAGFLKGANTNSAGWMALGYLFGRANLDFGSIAAGATAELTITVTGALVNDLVVVAPEGAPEAGLTWCAYVSASNTVTVRLANVTTGAIDPASRFYRVRVYKEA